MGVTSWRAVFGREGLVLDAVGAGARRCLGIPLGVGHLISVPYWKHRSRKTKRMEHGRGR